jgi:hypothetical protein
MPTALPPDQDVGLTFPGRVADQRGDAGLGVEELLQGERRVGVAGVGLDRHPRRLGLILGHHTEYITDCMGASQA